MQLSRRTVLGGGAAAVLGCAGGSSPPASPAPAGGEPGTLFRPAGPVAGAPAERVEVPGWFADAGAVYCPSPGSAGASLLTFVEQDGSQALCRQIRSFHELPALLERGRELGTDVLYLVDTYDPLPGAPCTEAWRNKGAYVARADLGGPEALKAGIRAVQQRGGRVLLYVEPFVVHERSEVGLAHGREWSIRRADGYPEEPYPDDWKICPANPAFVDHMADVVRRLVGEYGADGLHLDSYGFQRGWQCVETAHGHRPGEGAVFDDGARRLVERMLEEAKRSRPDAVLMCEGPKMPGLSRWVAASQDWGVHELVARWCWDLPGAVATCGWSLDDVHQILALGHRLTLAADAWHTAPQGTLADWYRAHEPVPARREARMRRYVAEAYFRALHRFRNAALLLGRPVPNVDAATPRRWERPEAFESHDAVVALVAEGRAFADRIDRELGGASLPSPTAHVRKLVLARARVAPLLRDARTTAVRVGAEHAAAYRMAGPRGVVLTAVSVDTVPVDLELPADAGAWTEVVDGGRAEAVGGRLAVRLPPHSVAMWVRV